ncbi:hypothetical protein PSHT_15824 [Puccinia striiformis]|uniref:Uncharacterized protein n=1 Tax=Puccinia striiformis TaxID=27350 RepID=A0A2S4UD13_9BASI|nr:hypothetical protein PSHT_15824 [Puccinia striiformis]
MPMENTLLSAIRYSKKSQPTRPSTQLAPLNSLTCHLMNICPCSVIEVTMAHCPKDVAILAQEIGVLDSEWELYSKSEAKVNLDIHDRLAHYKVGKYLVDTVGISAQENQVRNTM